MSASIGVSVRVRPSSVAGDHHGEEAAGVLRGHTWMRSVVSGSDQGASYAALGFELVEKLQEGYSCTLLAYGQTGSGKTYTMFGPTGCLTEGALAAAGGDGVPAPWGVFPRVALELLRVGGGAGGEVHASAVEVYNNVAYDLLDDNRQLHLSSTERKAGARPGVYGGHAESGGRDVGKSLLGLGGKHPSTCYCRLCFKANEEAKAARPAGKAEGGKSGGGAAPPSGYSGGTKKHGGGSFATVGETLWPIASPGDVARLARHVEASRIAHAHNLNDRSSRSHCLVRLQVASGGGRGGLLVRKQFLFADLAGSERTLKSGASGQRLAEATQINNSLTVLGRVIRGLGKSGRGPLPYRDSTLTMLLRSSFEPGGKGGSYTSVVINVASEEVHADETECSLQFGKRMAAVRNIAAKVVGTDVYEELARVNAKADAVRAKLRSLESAGLSGGFVEGARSMERQLLEENLEKHSALKRRRERLRADIAEAAGGARRGELERREAEARLQEETLGAVIFAQKTIKRLWKEPSAAYLSANAELRALTEQLTRLGGEL